MSDTQTHAVLAYIRRGDGAILSVWNRKYKCWGLPGGKVEDGESFDAALKRELFEETGLETARIWHPEIDVSPTYSGSGRLCHTFEVKPTIFTPIVRELETGVGWMTREFLEAESVTGAWFRAFFAKREQKTMKCYDCAGDGSHPRYPFPSEFNHPVKCKTCDGTGKVAPYKLEE